MNDKTTYLDGLMNTALLPRGLAHEIPRLIRAAAPFVLRDLRIREERAGANDLAALVALLREKFLRGFAVFDPADDGFVESGGRGAGTAEAVIDTGDEEQASERGRLLLPAHALLDALVVIDGARGRDELVSQAVINDDLAAAITEASE